jgi:hypothetical protein
MKRETANPNPLLAGRSVRLSLSVLSTFHVGTNEIRQWPNVCHLWNVQRTTIVRCRQRCRTDEQIFKGGYLSRDVGIMLPHGLMRICACHSFPTALPTHAWIPGQSLIPGECWSILPRLGSCRTRSRESTEYRRGVLHNTEYAYGGYVAWLLQGSKSLHADRPTHWMFNLDT